MASGQNRALALVRETLLPILALALSVSALHATRVRPINLEEMTKVAKRIFSGRVVEVRDMEDPKLGRRVTLVTVDVDRAVKGRADRTITFKQIAGPDPRTGIRSGIVGMPLYSKGEEGVLFLAGEGPTGLTSTLGLGQGKFVILGGRGGRRQAANEWANRSLLEGMSQEALGRLGTSAQYWRGRRGIPPEALLNMVETLKRKP